MGHFPIIKSFSKIPIHHVLLLQGLDGATVQIMASQSIIIIINDYEKEVGQSLSPHRWEDP